MSQISIIIPCYNVEKYLKRCLDSLIKQTFSEIEILCVDDGSEDHTWDILQEYAKNDARLHIFHQENDKGPGQARNVGLENATFPYIMFCDADDWYEPNMCEVMYKTIKQRKTDVVQCHTFFDYEKNYDSEIGAKRACEEYYNLYENGKYRLNSLIIAGSNEVLWNKIFSAEVIKRAGLKFERHINLDDSIFWFCLACSAKNIFYIHQKLYHYFFRSGSLMDILLRSKIQRLDRFFLLMNKVYSYLKKKGIHRRYQDFIKARFNAFLKSTNVLTSEELNDVKTNFKKMCGSQYFYYDYQFYQKKSYLYFILEYLRLRFALLYSKGKAKEKRIKKLEALILFYQMQKKARQ